MCIEQNLVAWEPAVDRHVAQLLTKALIEGRSRVLIKVMDWHSTSDTFSRQNPMPVQYNHIIERMQQTLLLLVKHSNLLHALHT